MCIKNQREDIVLNDFNVFIIFDIFVNVTGFASHLIYFKKSVQIKIMQKGKQSWKYKVKWLVWEYL